MFRFHQILHCSLSPETGYNNRFVRIFPQPLLANARVMPVCLPVCDLMSATKLFVKFSWNWIQQFCTESWQVWVWRNSVLWQLGVHEFLPAASVFRDQFLMTFSLKDLYIVLNGCEFRGNRRSEKHTLLRAQMKLCHCFLHFSPDLD